MSAYFKLIYFVAYFTHLILNVHFYLRNNFVPVIGAVENLFNVESNVIRFKVKRYLQVFSTRYIFTSKLS